jgi:hypothetical protein
MINHVLSKSTFLRGLQCHKALYLNKHHPELRDEISEQQQQIFSSGHEVGKLAQQLFPGGIDAGPKESYKYQESVLYTLELIKKGETVIYEAAFQYDGVLIIADILVRDQDKWNIYEVKSSTSVKDVYFLDTAIQYYVVTNSGIPVENISLVYINNQYIRKGDLDIHSLFKVESVLNDVLENQKFVEENTTILKEVLRLDKIPQIDIGEYCYDPYECDFRGYCWDHIPTNSVFVVNRLTNGKKFELYRSGIIKMDDIPENYPLSSGQRLQIDCEKQNRAYLNQDAIRRFVNSINYPLYYMDFETFNPAIPLFDNSRPYQQITFQYSLHFKESKNWLLQHYEFLGEIGKDPRRSFIERLLGNIQGEGEILVYNRPFEVTRLNELIRDFPEYENEIQEIISRIKDLMIPFQKKYYYKPEMRGSYSIKAVLPAVVVNLNYNGLAISEGGMAMNAFEQLQYVTDQDKIKETRKNLLEYCKMDTLAMVRILEELESM